MADLPLAEGLVAIEVETGTGALRLDLLRALVAIVEGHGDAARPRSARASILRPTSTARERERQRTRSAVTA